MISTVEKIGLYISSYLPLYPLLIYKEYDKIKIDVKKNNIGSHIDEIIFLIVLIFFIVISFCCILKFLIGKSYKRISISKNLQSSGDNIISYIMSYLVPMLSIDVDDRSSLVINLVLFFIIGILYVKNDLVYLNPVLSLIGYNFYIDENGEVVLTKFTLGQIKAMLEEGHEEVYGREISRGVYVYKEKIRKVKKD